MFSGLTLDQLIITFAIFLCSVATIAFIVFLISTRNRRHR